MPGLPAIPSTTGTLSARGGIVFSDLNVDGDVVAQNVIIATGRTVVVQAGKRKFARVQVA